MKDYEDIDEVEHLVLGRVRRRWGLRRREMSDEELYNHVKDTLFYQGEVSGWYWRILWQSVKARLQSIMIRIGSFIKDLQE